jgi:hypothetical protein
MRELRKNHFRSDILFGRRFYLLGIEVASSESGL